MFKGIGARKPRDKSKMNLYKNVINKCCWPGCLFGNDLEVHHIQPLKSGGKDEFVNYIVLCNYCHKHHRLHKDSSNTIAVLVYKFVKEQEALGFGICSDNYSDDEFWKLLKNKAFGWSLEVRNKDQEAQYAI